jgi:hypothetical protein
MGVSDKNRESEIASTLSEIGSFSQKCSIRLVRRLNRVRIARSLLTGLLLFVGLSTVAVAIISTQLSFEVFEQNTRLVLTIFGSFILVGVMSGILYYLTLGKTHDATLAELSSLVEQTKGKENPNPTPISNTLSIADSILAILPKICRKRNQDSVLFGLVAAILALVIVHLPIVASIIGVVVWLYFRYQGNKTYSQEISRIESHRRLFERRKQEFIDGL